MIKFANIGDFKVAQNFGYLKTPVVLENGMAVTYDLKTKAVALPTATTAKQAGLAVVMNRIDKPETLTPNDYRIEVGEFPRIFTLASLAGHLFDMDDAVVTTAYNTLAVGDKLVVGTDGKWLRVLMFLIMQSILKLWKRQVLAVTDLESLYTLN